MKLIIQIPCYNEAQTLGLAISQIPRQFPGIRQVEILIIDDGSSDNTIDIAKKAGVDHIISLPFHQGLARAFTTGLMACLTRGADIIVNTDADNQYNANDIPLLIQPLKDRQADIVIGTRPINSVAHFSPIKKYLQHLGSFVIRYLSHINIQDATSGFRAINRHAAMQINIHSRYTYTLEMLLQADEKNLRVTSVPIRVNPDLRPSRLVKSTASYVQRSVWTILITFVNYQPIRFFFSLGLFLSIIGLVIASRYLYLITAGEGRWHVQSVIFASLFIAAGFQSFLIGFLSSVQTTNRKLLENIQYQQRLKQYKKN
ncbi:MAG: glycosyltransferase family 2 protein [Candidatus Omnitrophota bacterium]